MSTMFQSKHASSCTWHSATRLTHRSEIILQLAVRFASALIITAIIATTNVAAGQFTRITSGDVVSDGKGSRSANFVDIDNDGDVDLFISNGKSGGENNMLYRNVSGVLIRDITDVITLDGKSSDGATFADIDNDGDIDAFVANWYNQHNLLYYNNGSGAFTQNTTDTASKDGGYSEAGSFADYDNDGFVDLFVANSSGNLRNFLYHNNGAGGFTKVGTGIVATDAEISRLGSWADYDNDGDLDLFVCNESNQPNTLYRNDGAGAFTRIATGDLVSTPGEHWTCSWGDYDNDLDLDLFVGGTINQFPELYRNNGDGTFATITSGSIVTTPGWNASSSWVDYDYDGDLDLFVVNGFGGANAKKVNYLFQNSAGVFTRILGDTLVSDSGWGYGHSWGDYDSDGDLDVVVARWRNENENDALYRNDLVSGAKWLTVRVSGGLSNRSAIGARVYVGAVIGGNPVTQMREISSQSGYCSQNSLDVSIGLGDATTADSVRVWWPNGADTTLYNVSANQLITISECADPDNDGICSELDTCPNDPLNDPDGDGACESTDNCPGLANPSQINTDGDALGDLCDSCPLNPLNPCCCQVAGDADNDGELTINDAVFLISYIFLGGPTPTCIDEGDSDGTNEVSISDAVYDIAYIFLGGPSPICGTTGT